MALADTNTHFREKLRKHFLSEITHRKNLSQKWILLAFLRQKLKNGPCTKVNIFLFCLLFLTESKSVKNEKILSPQMIKVCKKISTFQNKKWFFGHFCDFGQNTKMAKNPFFLLKSGNFFLHTLIIWGDLNFSVFTFLIWSKKVGENGKWALFCTGHFFSFSPFLPTFFDRIKKCITWKMLVFPND